MVIHIPTPPPLSFSLPSSLPSPHTSFSSKGAEATLDKLIELVGSLGCKEGVDVLTKAKGKHCTFST